VGESDGWMAEAAEEIEAELQRRKEEVPQDGGQPEDLAKRFNVRPTAHPIDVQR
jgi:hypothetical protein